MALILTSLKGWSAFHIMMAAVTVLLGLGYLGFFAMTSISPDQLSYHRRTVAGVSASTTYKGQPQFFVVGPDGRRTGFACLPFQLKNDCLARSYENGLKPGSDVEVDYLSVKGPPLFNNVVIEIRTVDRVVMSAPQRLAELGLQP